MIQEDFLDELGELALGSRLKRLGDRLMTDANGTYQAFGNTMQPKWFVLLALLYRKEQVSIVEAADYLGISQPAISQFSGDLVKKKWVSISYDKNDGRRKILQLSKQGKIEVEKLQPMWRAVDKAAKELCEEVGNDFFKSLQKFEQALMRKSMTARALEYANGQ